MDLETVLLVDDEELVLSSYQRVLRRQFQFEIATSGRQVIDMILAGGSYAVIVSDMRMPGMNGVELLQRVKEISPATVRLMLTGNSDVTTAIDAVNEGSVFRFLTKPCPPEILAKALSAGLAQYRLVRAEKQLLEETLHGSIRVLTEVLGLINPAAFNQSFRIAGYVRAVAQYLNLPDAWQYEVAAMLANVGSVVLPRDSAHQSEQTSVVQRLLGNIPRLDQVAAIVGQAVSEAHQANWKKLSENPVRVGAEILRICTAFDALVADDMTAQAAVVTLRDSTSKGYCPKILDALTILSRQLFEYESIVIRTEMLDDHMVFDQDLRSHSGMLLVAKGSPITQSLLFRLRSFRDRRMLPAEVRVLVPSHYLNTLQVRISLEADGTFMAPSLTSAIRA